MAKARIRKILASLLFFALTTSAQKRIVGGQESDVSRFPYFVSIYDSSVAVENHLCGASLVARDFVLTAAHCYNALRVEKLVVVVNNTSPSANNPYSHTRRVVLVFTHLLYNPRSTRNDIMLLKLEFALPESVPILDIDLDTGFEIKNELVAIGLGLTSEEGTELAPALREVTLLPVAFDDCRSVYESSLESNLVISAFVETEQLCAAAPGRDTCTGDSGGPIIVPGDGNAADLQVGITSFGTGCGRQGFPGVYTRTSGFQKWLETKICSNSAYPPGFCPAIDETTPPPTRPQTLQSRSIRMDQNGLVVFTSPTKVLQTRFGSSEASWPLPDGVTTYDDVSISSSEKFVFALDITNQIVCSYRIVNNFSDQLSFIQCYKGNWVADPSLHVGISCLGGQCVIAEGILTVMNYNSETGEFIGENQLDHLSQYSFQDVQMVTPTLVAVSTSFGNREFGTIFVDLTDQSIVGEPVRLGVPLDLAVLRANFPLVNSFYENDDETIFMYTAHGDTSVVNLSDRTVMNFEADPGFSGNFQAVSISVDRQSKIAAVGGLFAIGEGEIQSWLTYYDITLPTNPSLVNSVPVVGRLLSVAANNQMAAVVSIDVEDVQIIEMKPSTNPSTPSPTPQRSSLRTLFPTSNDDVQSVDEDDSIPDSSSRYLSIGFCCLLLLLGLFNF